MALVYQPTEVQLVVISGQTYRLVDTQHGCDILQRVNHWAWVFVDDQDGLSSQYDSRDMAVEAAAEYRAAVEAAGGESPAFARDVFVASEGWLRWKGQVTAVSSVQGMQGVKGKAYDPITGELGTAEYLIQNVVLLPADQLTQGTRDLAETALSRYRLAAIELEDAEADLQQYGAQLTAHPSAVVVPVSTEIDTVTRVQLSDALDPAP